MRTILLVCLGIGLSALAAAAADAETAASGHTRSAILKAKIDIQAKDVPLIDFLKDVAAEVEKQQIKAPKWTYAPEVERTQRLSYSGKGQSVEQILAAVFKGQGLGYVVVAGEDDKYDGFIRIAKGDERGFAKGAEPSADDKLATARLNLAAELLKEGKAVPARALLARIVKDYPGTGAAKEAARLLETIDK